VWNWAEPACNVVASTHSLWTAHAGFMREYIELGSLAHVHRNCLYMHGGIVGGGCKADEHAVGAVPGSDERIDDVHEWVAALNQ
jgi:hypothetical protein